MDEVGKFGWDPPHTPHHPGGLSITHLRSPWPGGACSTGRAGRPRGVCGDGVSAQLLLTPHGHGLGSCVSPVKKLGHAQLRLGVAIRIRLNLVGWSTKPPGHRGHGIPGWGMSNKEAKP